MNVASAEPGKRYLPSPPRLTGLEGSPAPLVPSIDGWEKRREDLRGFLALNPIPGVSPEQERAHLDGMPARYWSRVMEAELIWDLQVIQQFTSKRVAAADQNAAVVVAFRNYPEDRGTKVLICTQDRLGLLTQLAGFFSALRLNIQKAEVYTRQDGIALDVFWIRDETEHSSVDLERLKHLTFLLEGRFENPPRFASSWVGQSHRYAERAGSQPPVIAVDNESSAEFTVVSIAAAERLGLLHDIVEVFTDLGLNIVDAQINTVGLVAHDVLFVTDSGHKKVADDARIDQLTEALTRAVG